MNPAQPLPPRPESSVLSLAGIHATPRSPALVVRRARAGPSSASFGVVSMKRLLRLVWIILKLLVALDQADDHRRLDGK